MTNGSKVTRKKLKKKLLKTQKKNIKFFRNFKVYDIFNTNFKNSTISACRELNSAHFDTTFINLSLITQKLQEKKNFQNPTKNFYKSQNKVIVKFIFTYFCARVIATCGECKTEIDLVYIACIVWIKSH